MRLWFIRYIYDASAKKLGNFFQWDEAKDRRAFKLAEKSKETISNLSQAMEMKTKAIEENGKDDSETLNLFRAKLVLLCSQLSDG